MGVRAKLYEDLGRIRGVQEGNAFAIGAGLRSHHHPVPHVNEPTELRFKVLHMKGDVVQARPPLFEVLGDGAVLSLIHISEPTRLGMISYAVFCLKKKNNR